MLIKIPIAFDSFWAEDGAFYSQALVEAFPIDFFISGGGYVIFVSRILSNLVANFPVYYAALANAVLLCCFYCSEFYPQGADFTFHSFVANK